MKSLLFILFLALNANAFASSPYYCDIKSKASAAKCMERLAKKMASHEEPNDFLVAKGGEDLANALEAQVITPKQSILDEIRNADYVGMIIRYDDENHFFYFVLNKGVAPPKFAFDLNMADFNLDSKFSGKKPEALDYFLGEDSAKDLSVFEDVENALKK